MFTVFTCCANNYLAHAKTLGDSVLAHNPDSRFVIILVDKLDEDARQVDLSRFEVIEIEDLGIPELESMTRRYRVYELSVAVKPFAFEHLLHRQTEPEPIIFLDPDIMLTGPLHVALQQLETHNLVLTPHALSPIDDDKEPKEQTLFKYGTYNAGFVGLRPSEETRKLLTWWKKRLVHGAFADVQKGYFGDQFWLAMAPLYFDDVLVSRDRGYNVAIWNLHERVLSKKGDGYLVNEETPLTFFHFSGFDPFDHDLIARGSNRYYIHNRPDLKELFDDYRNKLLANQYEMLIGKKCAYQPSRKVMFSRMIVTMGFGFQAYLPLGLRTAIRRVIDRIVGSRLYS